MKAGAATTAPSIASGIVVDNDGWVVNNSPVAVALGLVRNGRLAHPALSDLADSVRADGVIRELELELHRGEPRTGDSHWAGTYVHARVAPLSDRHVLLLVEDRTQSHRVEQVRRDFLAAAAAAVDKGATPADYREYR